MQQRHTSQVFCASQANESGDQASADCSRSRESASKCLALLSAFFRAARRINSELWITASSRLAWKRALPVVICLLLGGCSSTGVTVKPSIEFTRVPEANDGGPDKADTIEGRVTGARSGQKIVLFAKSGVWWVQPFSEQPFTTIQPDSTWKNTTHYGTEYAALLVEPAYNPPATIDTLPAEGGAVVAVVSAKGQVPSPETSNTLHFSGYEWKIRSTASERGGMTNTYDPENAWTDANGLLHLRIAKRSGQWTCAEVRLTRSLGYGSYLFVVRDTSHLEPSAVLTMFTWDDQRVDQNHREMNIEITRWGDIVSKNAQYVVQPYYVPANVARFAAPAGVLTHSFRWEPGRVAFRTVRGAVTDSGSRVVAEHVFTSGVPSPGDESVHLNLYVFSNTSKPLQNDVEVVIEKFEYLP